MNIRKPRPTREMSVADAVSEACGDLAQLGEEMREWADSMEEKFSGTEKYDRVSGTADALENISEPEAPDWAKSTMTTIVDLPARKRGYSRSDRCSHAISILEDAYNLCDERVSELGDDDNTQEERETIETYRDEIEEIKGIAEEADFPGMYG